MTAQVSSLDTTGRAVLPQRARSVAKSGQESQSAKTVSERVPVSQRGAALSHEGGPRPALLSREGARVARTSGAGWGMMMRARGPARVWKG
eukprot:3080443-Prymnesium_polylepis.1